MLLLKQKPGLRHPVINYVGLPLEFFCVLLTHFFMHMHACVQWLSHVWLSVALWTVAHQAPLSMEFSRREYWNGLPFPNPEDPPNPRIEPMSFESPQTDSILLVPHGKLCFAYLDCFFLLFGKPWNIFLKARHSLSSNRNSGKFVFLDCSL